MNDVPILIAGGSLAGMSCALRLKQLGREPVVLEKSKFPRPKLCGEFLGPTSLESLDSLELLEKVESIAYGPIHRVHFYDQRGRLCPFSLSNINGKYDYGVALARTELDWLLMSEGRKQGITVFENVYVHSVQDDGNTGFSVRTVNQEVWRTPIFVNASGRHGLTFINSPANKKTIKNAKPRDPDRIGLQLHFHLPKREDEKRLHMFLFPEGYGGIQYLNNGEANICLLLHRSSAGFLKRSKGLNAEEILSQTLGQNPVAAKLLQGGRAITPILTTAQLNLSPPENLSMISVGDALATIDPMTGSGMALAMKTGILAAEVIHHGLAKGRGYEGMRQQYVSQFNQRFRQRFSYLKYCRPLFFSSHLQQLFWPVLPYILPRVVRRFY